MLENIVSKSLVFYNCIICEAKVHNTKLNRRSALDQHWCSHAVLFLPAAIFLMGELQGKEDFIEYSIIAVTIIMAQNENKMRRM